MGSAELGRETAGQAMLCPEESRRAASQYPLRLLKRKGRHKDHPDPGLLWDPSEGHSYLPAMSIL